jgi:hypothetical protein
MTSTNGDSEQRRYVRYLQRQLAREGSESYLDGHQEWFAKNRSRIATKLLTKNSEVGGKLARTILSDENEDKYDDVLARQIFQPLLKIALDICGEAGLGPRQPVTFMNSPGVEPSPASVPSSQEHVMFIGRGTSSFCNYWSKVFSTALAEVGDLSDDEWQSPAAIIAKLRQGQVLVDASRLAVRYALTGSVLSSGPMPQAENLLIGRTLLLNSMEMFVIGHELGHFISHEEYPLTDGIAPGSGPKDLERSCDFFGFTICTGYGVREGNAFSFQLLGPSLLFYALMISESAVALLSGQSSHVSDSHPSNEQRLGFVFDFLDEVKATQDLKNNLQSCLDIAGLIGAHVLITLEDAANALGETELQALRRACSRRTR